MFIVELQSPFSKKIDEGIFSFVLQKEIISLQETVSRYEKGDVPAITPEDDNKETRQLIPESPSKGTVSIDHFEINELYRIDLLAKSV